MSAWSITGEHSSGTEQYGAVAPPGARCNGLKGMLGLRHRAPHFRTQPDDPNRRRGIQARPGAQPPKERDGILAKLKIKGKLTNQELATYGITETQTEESKANGEQEETLDRGAVVSEPARLFSGS